MEPLISIRSLNHYFGKGALRKQILFDVNEDVLPGEIVIVTGPSGSGKTTLLTLIGALRSIEEGSVRTMNYELKAAPPPVLAKVRKCIGFIFQAHNLLKSLTAIQNVQMGLHADGGGTSSDRDKSIEVLRAVGLAERIDYLPGQMSGGQNQRVAIARALVRQPRIILADEPTAALDKTAGREVVELLHNLAKSQHCAVVMVTHDNRILDIADRIVTLEDGHLTSFTSGLVSNTGNLFQTFAQLSRKNELQRQIGTMSDAQFIQLLEQATAEFSELLETMDLANNEASEALFADVLAAISARLRQVLQADRATIYLIDSAAGKLHSWVAEHDGKPLHITLPLGEGIAGRVAATGKPANLPDAYADPDFHRQTDVETGYRTRSMLCMPMFDRSGKPLAVAQLLNKQNGEAFTIEDQQKFESYTRTLSLILESCVRLQAQTSK